MRLNKPLEKAIFFISFFAYSGYYAGLAFVISSGNIKLSRYYSVPLRVFLAITMLYIIIKNKNNWRKHVDTLYFPAIVLFSLLYMIKVLITVSNYNDYLSHSWYEYFFYFLSFSIIPFFTFSLINFKKYKKVILDGFILSGFILGAVSLYLYKDILAMGLGRISLIKYDSPNTDTLSPLNLSYGGVLTIILCVYKLIFEKVSSIKSKIYLYLNIILSFIMFFLGASRGSLVVLILSIPFLIYHASFKNKGRIFLMVVIAIPLVLYGVQKTGSAIFERTESTINTGEASGRQPLLELGYEEFIQNPIFGGRIEVGGIYPHNVFLEVLMATGIIGFLLFSICFFSSLIKGFRLLKHNRTYIVPFLILINGISQYMFSGSIYAAILLFIPMGMIFSANSRIAA